MRSYLKPYPINRGYRMPAEWERHAATWLTWPHNVATWPDMLTSVEKEMVSIVMALSETEVVRVNVLNKAHEDHVSRLLHKRVAPGTIIFHQLATNDSWCRDCGAIFLTSSNQEHPLLSLNFKYNAWGGKYPPYNLDQGVAEFMARTLLIPEFLSKMYLEGGAVDVNGAGTLITTLECLLKRNPEMSQIEIEQELKNTFGVKKVIWLGKGLEGDDTDGHIDQLARFVSHNRVVISSEENPKDYNYLPLIKSQEILANAKLADGAGIEIVELPMPDPIYYQNSRLPASYANFYIANELVIMPAFGCPQDAIAREILSECFMDRNVISVDCRSILVGLGAVHCLTQQVPWIG